MIFLFTSVVVSAVLELIDDFRRLLPVWARFAGFACSAGFLISISWFQSCSFLPELISLRLKFQNSNLSIRPAFRATVFDRPSSLRSRHRFSQEAVLKEQRSGSLSNLRRYFHLSNQSCWHQNSWLWLNCLPKKCYIERRLCWWENSISAVCPVLYRFYRNVTENNFKKRVCVILK